MAKPRVRIDWATGVSSAITVDVTSDIIGEIECWRGRSYYHPVYRSQGVGVAGHCRFYLRNVSNKYSFDDDKLPTGRRVRIQLQVGATTWRTMWTGYIDTFDYQYRRDGYDRVEVSALGPISQLETGTWSIANTSPDPRAYDVINSIVEGVTDLGVENSPDYNRTGNRNLEPPGGGANEGVRDWSVRLENFQIEEAPALQTVRDAATISFAHVYETASGRIRIDGLPNRQAKINGGATMTFRDSSGAGVRVHSYDISLKNERVANAAAKSILDRFEPVDTDIRHVVASGEIGTIPLGTPNEREFWFSGPLEFFRMGSSTRGRSQAYNYPGPREQVYYEGTTPTLQPWIGGLVYRVYFEPASYLQTDPDGVLDPVMVTPDPYEETVTFANNYNATTRVLTTYWNEGAEIWRLDPLTWTESDSTRLTVFNDVFATGTESSVRREYGYTYFAVQVFSNPDAPSAERATWEITYEPFMAGTSGSIIAQNDTSIGRYGRRGYAVPGIFWGPDTRTTDQYLDIRSFVGYIVRDEFLGTPGYYGTIVVDLTRQFYPTTGATNPELDVGDKITLYQGTTSRDYLVSAIRYRFRQGEQLRAQIECAPARVM